MTARRRGRGRTRPGGRSTPCGGSSRPGSSPDWPGSSVTSGLGEDLAHDALAAALEQWPRTGRPGQPRGLAHDRRQASRRRLVAAANGARAKARGARTRARGRAGRTTAGPTSTKPATISATTCCVSSSWPVIRCSPPRRGWRSPCACSGASPLMRSRAPILVRGADRRPADRAGQAHARRGAACPSRSREGADRAARLSSVLEVIYLIFNEGYSATAGDDWMRPALCEDALRLGGSSPSSLPERARGPRPRGADGDPGARGSARGSAPSGAAGPAARPGPRPLGHAAHPARAGRARSSRRARSGDLGPYALQAAIAACHARARTAAETDWARIAALYDALAAARAVPVVELNRAVAVCMAFGPSAALELVDALLGEPALAGYHLLPSVRGDLLEKLGRFDEAGTEFERAAQLTRNGREATLLLERAASSRAGGAQRMPRA